jgi:hypothetical protein
VNVWVKLVLMLRVAWIAVVVITRENVFRFYRVVKVVVVVNY